MRLKEKDLYNLENSVVTYSPQTHKPQENYNAVMPDEISVTEKFGQRVRALRRERGLSQENLAELSGLDRTYISGIERGVRNVALRNIEALARGLGVSISDLFADF